MQPFLSYPNGLTPALKFPSPRIFVNDYRPCKRCSNLFRVYHGNQRLCGECRRRGTPGPRGRQTFGLRSCDLCGRRFTAHAAHQRFCSPRCQRWGTAARDKALYATPTHRAGRRWWEPRVAAGVVRCARAAACVYAELVDGELVGGLIHQGEPWHLGHPDGESAGGPEHRRCNVGAPQRQRARKRGQVGRIW